jgi:hypothetical protein
MENIPQIPVDGEERVFEGEKYRWTKTQWTIREYYSHHTDKGIGPGWDTRGRLLDQEYSLKRFGRTFTEKEVFEPQNLPDIPYYEWQFVEE